MSIRRCSGDAHDTTSHGVCMHIHTYPCASPRSRHQEHNPVPAPPANASVNPALIPHPQAEPPVQQQPQDQAQAQAPPQPPSFEFSDADKPAAVFQTHASLDGMQAALAAVPTVLMYPIMALAVGAAGTGGFAAGRSLPGGLLRGQGRTGGQRPGHVGAQHSAHGLHGMYVGVARSRCMWGCMAPAYGLHDVWMGAW
eukprot:359710-Chlamydomonas_euryale.AAC.4